MLKSYEIVYIFVTPSLISENVDNSGRPLIWWRIYVCVYVPYVAVHYHQYIAYPGSHIRNIHCPPNYHSSTSYPRIVEDS